MLCSVTIKEFTRRYSRSHNYHYHRLHHRSIIRSISNNTINPLPNYEKNLFKRNNKNEITSTATTTNSIIKRNIASNNSNNSKSNNNQVVKYVKIGLIQCPIKNNNNNRPHLKAKGYISSFPTTLSTSSTSTINKHLQWMMKKDILKQDMLLIGSPPGASTHLRRNVALSFSEILQRNVQIITITSDLTESDLKQRRELKMSSTDTGKTNNLELSFVDAAPVDAARNGDILILDGIEKASRNVLPTLNNLLEHREMNLEDGRFLVSQERYDNNHKNKNNEMMIPVHDDFRVIATTSIPSSFSSGVRRNASTIDPPLRSRFQIRRIDFKAQDYYYSHPSITYTNNNKLMKQLFSIFTALEYTGRQTTLATTTNNNIWPFPIHQIPKIYQLIEMFGFESEDDVLEIIKLYYPLIGFYEEPSIHMTDGAFFAASARAFYTAWNETIRKKNDNNNNKSSSSSSEYMMKDIHRDAVDDTKAMVVFESITTTNDNKKQVNLTVPCGPYPFQKNNNYYVTKGLQKTIQSMVQSHANSNDMLLLSPPGQGKTSTISHFASLLGYSIQIIHIYPDMTTNDFFLRRITHPETGETSWESTLLLKAIQKGNVMIVLDHIDKLRHDVLSSLQSLCLERDFFLSDGRRIISKDRYFTNSMDECGDDNDKVIYVHPSFRIVGLASSNNIPSWFTEDAMSMFSTIILPTPTNQCLQDILKSVIVPQNNDDNDDPYQNTIINKLLKLHTKLTPQVAEDCGVLSSLSIRNLIRIVRRIVSSSSSSNNDKATQSSSLHRAVCEILVADLLPPTQRAALESLLKRVDIQKSIDATTNNTNESPLTIQINKEYCTIGNKFQFKRKIPQRIEMVPSPKFFDIPSHVNVIHDLLHDWKYGERAFLLLGNQGVGKNMIVDRLCQAANFEREYIQLHRDSTIGQLTIQPSLINGRVVWKDDNSPFLRAVIHGHALVVDEADKAPVDVLAVLKGLVEDGEMILADGRRVSRLNNQESSTSTTDTSIIPIHEDFTLIVLANRPGFPFLGNAFIKTIGDVFSTRVISNPDLDSEIHLLSSYGPNVAPKLIKRLAASFAELRSLSDHGEIYYPYSTREAVAVVKHLECFKDDDVVSALHNVLDFDTFDQDVYATIGKVFRKHAIPVQNYANWQKAILKQDRNNLEIEYSKKGNTSSSTDGISANPPSLSTPKEGKWDENNNPHVGGNQWAGGTGGSDTAGLGGRGGPYRLDRGHKLHQVSDEAKEQVSAEAARVAKTMAQEALNERLSDINMSEQEWSQYKRFVDPIQKEIASLRAILAQTDTAEREEGWIKRQLHGELDETRLVEGVTGEKRIYKRRGVLQDFSGTSPQPKKMRFVVDVSGSMYRFNGYDNRLYRCLEATNLIMESLHGMQQRFDYSIVGHSGDSPCIPFVNFGQPPITEKEKMKVLQMMIAHSQYCQAGDYTLEAIEKAIYDIQKEDNTSTSGDSLVIAFSDANLERYSIHPRALGKIMEQKQEQTSTSNVKAHCIFIASFGEEADLIKSELPVGRGHVCMETNELPRVVRNILARQI